MHDNKRDLERKSSAVTLSDMEVFIFPELIYSLVLANIMSPRIWHWRDDPWFDGLARMKPYRRILRLKQYIMDHYIFNLDLDTWGLTTKQKEIERFRGFIDEDTLARSNALFGYEGDKYYFDIDIRTHFGLDKYEGDVIPYWKTETVEAMDAFVHKPDYPSGAGECVSLATLYAAALFIVARIPLKDIYLMATPLHSQNLIDVDDGILTNNRRLVTKNMWFNGTALSAQARRALENERVTLVAHETGCIHTVYRQATIDPSIYAHFSDRLRGFLRTPLSKEILGSFLRHDRGIQKCFQFRLPIHGVDHYAPMERIFAYEHGGPYNITDNTRDKLLAEVDMEEFQERRLPSRIVLNDLEDFVSGNSPDMHDAGDVEGLKREFASDCLSADIAIESLRKFCCTEPRLPEAQDKEFVGGTAPLGIDPDMSREEIIERVESIGTGNEAAAMAFYACRDLNRTEPEPFLKAAFQRNPVAVRGAREMSAEELAEKIAALPGESIYDEPGRLAQPDEVWNFGRGDGAEKALLLASVLHGRDNDADIRLIVENSAVTLKTGSFERRFSSSKGLRNQTWAVPES